MYRLLGQVNYSTKDNAPQDLRLYVKLKYVANYHKIDDKVLLTQNPQFLSKGMRVYSRAILSDHDPETMI